MPRCYRDVILVKMYARYACIMQHKGWHSRGFLPHFDSQEVVQLVTFRLSDSLPAQAMERVRAGARPESLREEFLDQGWGACWLKADEIAQCVEQSFLIFDGVRYRLHAWTIMPNHVHVLLSPLPEWPLGIIVGSWKRFSAREANKRLGRTGAFWQVDYWDRFIRNGTHFSAALSYVDLNPVKAGLVAEASLWPWGSARLRQS